MSGDYSRRRFEALNDFSGVLMQQGRVQLDADWNELVDILDRRGRATSLDTFGQAAVPRETPDGFKIEIAGGALTIGRGRLYVDGLLAENHGSPPLEFDARLAEPRGSAATPYEAQPYLPDAAPLPESGPHLAYLEVWQREVTALEHPDLVEPALGVDTTTRRQTVWQVKVLPNVGDDVTCATPEAEIEGWSELTRPSGGRLSTAAVGVASADDPCLIPPSGGYRGLENRLYRVEIHDGGPAGSATFKWSRDNGTVASAITAVDGVNLIVEQVGRDDVLRFDTGDWVEITDDGRELNGAPGHIRQVAAVDDATLTLTLNEALPGDFAVAAERHPRVRRWDQHGALTNTDGVIPVPPQSTSVVLEDGVQITFDTPDGDAYRVGDYWVFAARTADAAVEVLDNAPPHGIHRHFCRLAVVRFPDTVSDCRTLWPPLSSGESCDCSVCVTAASHNSGALTIQQAIDQVRDVGGTVCLDVGLYNLRAAPLRLEGARSVRLKGQGWKTQLVYVGGESAIAVEGSFGVTLEAFALLSLTAAPEPQVALRNCIGVTLRRCFLLQNAREGDERAAGLVVGLAGVLAGVVLRENVLFAADGIGGITARDDDNAAGRLRPLLTAGLYIEDNFLFCRRRGISLDGLSLHTGVTRLNGNFVSGGEAGGIVARGFTAPGSGLDVGGNRINVSGPAIVAGVSGARVSGNDISGAAGAKNGPGIVLDVGLDGNGLDGCQVLHNRITDLSAGEGIGIRTRLRAAIIAHNIIEGASGGGVVMSATGSAEVLSINGNQIRDVAAQVSSRGAATGIRLLNVEQADVADNIINGVGVAAESGLNRVGIQLAAVIAARLDGNSVGDVGPDRFIGEAAGIEVLPGFTRLDITGNSVRRGGQPATQEPDGIWRALHIRRVSGRESTSRIDVLELDGRITLLRFGNAFFGLFGGRVTRLRTERASVAVRGNLLEAHGEAATTEIVVGGPVIFTDNRCLLTTLRTRFVALVTGEMVVATSNYLERQGPPADAVVLRLQTGGEKSFTVTGNIARNGTIDVNGAALSTPWLPLNVFTA